MSNLTIPTSPQPKARSRSAATGSSSALARPKGDRQQDGARFEVKPSAARQPWTGHGSLEGRAARGSFDIGERKGYGIDGGKEHVAWTGRPADLFVFAWHPVSDPALVDHHDLRQRLFFVVPEPALPVRQKRLGLALIERRWPAVGFADLPRA